MTARAIAAAALTFVTAGLLAIEIFSWPQSARFGPTVSPGSPCAPVITSVGQADRTAGLSEGDKITLPEMDLPSRVAVFYRYLPMQTGRANQTIRLSIAHDGQRKILPYTLRHQDSRLTFAAQLFFKLFILGLGLLVLWRGRDRASLALAIWCLGICIALPDAWWGALPVNGRILGGVLTAALWTYSPLPLYLVIESITQNVSRITILFTRAAMVLTIVPAFIVNTVNGAAQAESGCALIPIPQALVNTLFIATQLLMLGFFILSYTKSAGLLRQRIRWVFWAFLISRFGVLLNLANRLVVHPFHLSGIEWLTVMLFPLGCAYAILRHRIIDVNFVLNRTLVYTLLTSLAVGVFILLEDILNSVAAGRGISLAVELAVALSIGFSFEALRKRITDLIERTLFRRKHRAAVVLQQLSEEAAFTESADALLGRAVTEIPLALGASGAAIYERADEGYRLVAGNCVESLPKIVPVDDLAFVRLRKRLAEVDLSDVSSALESGGLAFPLAVRGQLVGALICCQRIDGETYAPDEVALVRNVAHEVGAELHAIRARQHTELLDALISGSIDLRSAQARLEAIGSPVAS